MPLFYRPAMKLVPMERFEFVEVVPDLAANL
jgi:hypothetical protein